MIKRRIQRVVGLSVAALCILILAADAQENRQSSEPKGSAARDTTGSSALNKNTNSENSSTGDSKTMKPANIYPLVKWVSTLPDKSTQPSKTTASPQGDLSFAQAVALALQNNLATLLARERRNEARGVERQTLAGLLPNIEGAASQSNLTSNLAAQGLTPGSFPIISKTFIGPFNVFDARVQIAQSIFNLSAIRTYQAGRSGSNIAEIGEQLSRQQVIAKTAISYLNALRSERALEAAKANLDLAQVLFKLATDQHNAGVATGIDVTRAETRLAQERYRFAQAQTDIQRDRLEVLRITGLPLGGSLTLTDKLIYTEQTLPAAQTAVDIAEQERVEIRLAREQVKFADFQRRAAVDAHLPSIDFVADYGASGSTPDVNDLATRGIGIRLNVPIFDGGYTNGRVGAATSRQRQAEMQLKDQRDQVEQDVRLALLTIATAAEQVRAADQALRLAENELRMARDRFAAGIGDNIEVVNAQTSLADARDAQITALSTHAAARINLASAMGRVESFTW